MRFSVAINLQGEPPFQLPYTYRRNLINLLKEALSNDDTDDVYSEYWGCESKNRQKPFTFSMSIKGPQYVDSDASKYLQLNIPTLKLHVSSSDSNFLSTLYKGLLKMSSSLKLFNYPVEFREFYIKNIKSIKSDYVKFRILSPVLVRDIAVIGKKKNSVGYLFSHDTDFIDSLIFSIRTLCNHFLKNGQKINQEDIEIDISDCKSVVLSHYYEVIPGIKGVIGIRAHEDVLKLIYDIGLGARRSQGFGMVDFFNGSENGTVSVVNELVSSN
jgi:CRISPR-associated endoribonuclease Cas6